MAKPVLAVCTMDTKGSEIAYIASCIRKTGGTVLMVDVGTKDPPVVVPDVPREVIAACHPNGAAIIFEAGDRGDAVTAMGEALQHYCKANAGSFSAIIGIGGSGGTALITPAMRSLAIGFPKVMVSTMASGNVAPYVGSSDITMMYSVADVAGINPLSAVVLGNAASCVAGMVRWPPAQLSGGKPALAMSMFGVTTTCCDAVRKTLESDYDSIVFHATGSGGKGMEKLIDSGLVSGVLDLTTTEVADEVVGGILTAGPERFDAIVRTGLPCVMSLGALDMVNFGARDSVPETFSGRKLHVHNSEITLMRTTSEENRLFAAFISGKINKATGPLTLLIPEKGISAIDVAGAPFHDPDADAALFQELERLVEQTPTRKICRVPHAINDPEFAERAVAALREIMPAQKSKVAAGAVSSAFSPAERAVRTTIPASIPGPRDAVLKSLRSVMASGKPIIGAGAGTGISAKFEEAGGADLIIIYNSGKFRMAGHGSLSGMMPFKDANAVMLEMGEEILPILKQAPLLAGVCAQDPFRRMDRLLAQVKDMGFAGVQNFPTVGLIDGNFRKNLEETGMSYQKEVEMIAKAHEMGLFTTPYCFNGEEARMMAAAGADIIVAHMGLTTSGSIGAATAFTLDDSVRLCQEIADAAKSVNPDVIVLTHGGPIAMPEDAQYVQSRVTGVHGFYGASSAERLPVEIAITEQMRKFKCISMS